MLKESLDKLENSDVFKSWKSENEKAHLSHVFVLLDELNKSECQIGYYNPDTEKITTFVVGDEIIQNPAEEVFKEQKNIVKEVKLDKVKTDVEDALKTADDLQKEKYKTEIPIKRIIILQNLEVGQVWNITYVTQSMQTLNIKIDSETGEIKSDKLVSLLEFRK
ncbi:hypothetical protein ACFLZ7_00940 [Nanoarchaeota archaeon]